LFLLNFIRPFWLVFTNNQAKKTTLASQKQRRRQRVLRQKDSFKTSSKMILS